jgi:spore coat polysaccharide biosynthesis protein SpsF
MTRIIGTIEARMGSTRLPQKTLKSVFNGMPLLECVVRRFQKASSLSDVVVATTDSGKDDPIAEWCLKNNISFHRGSEDDVLDRVVQTATKHEADAIVQMGADSAYLDFELIDHLVSLYKTNDYHYVCNDLRLTYPLGIYGHIVKVQVLKDLNARNDLNSSERSDVVRHIFENPAKYKILNIEADKDFNYPQLRLTIDYPEDLEQAHDVYKHFNGFNFTTSQIINLFKERPEIFSKTQKLVQHSAPFLVKK